LDYITVDPDFFAGNSVARYRTLEQCRGFLGRMMGRSYSQKIANVAGVSCWGAFPGTYSSYEKEVPLPVLSVLRTGSGNGRDFAPYLRLITQSLGLAADPRGRGFVEFFPQTLQHQSVASP